MHVLTSKSLKSNKKIKINFDGGSLSSDAGALLLKEFIYKAGFDKTLKRIFKTILDKKRLASQPTLSRFFHRMDQNTLEQFENPKNLRGFSALLGSKFHKINR